MMFGNNPRHALSLILLVLCCLQEASAFFAVRQIPASLPSQQQQKQQQQQYSPLYAKKKKKGGKKGGKGGKNQKQQSGFEWATSFVLKPFEAKETRDLASAALSSFQGITGKPLCDDLKGSVDLPKTLWNTPDIACVVLSAPENDGGIPAVRYANVAALETVGLQPNQFERFINMSGNKNSYAENPVVIDLPNDMKGDKKYQRGYEKKILRGKDGNDITILNAHRWAVEKSTIVEGKFVTETLGVAYAWEEWLLGEHTVCRPGGIQETRIDVGEIEESIQAKAAAIRELKEVQGLGNKDPEVIEAVQELLGLKALLEEVQT